MEWTETTPPENTRGKAFKSGEYQISPIGKTGRYFLACGEAVLIRGTSIAKCKAKAEEHVTAANPLADACSDFDKLPTDVLEQAAAEPQPTDAEINAAYDKACPCLPEIEAAMPAPTEAEINKEIDGKHVQEALNELYWKHGKNFLTWPNATDLCEAAGIDKGKITPAMIKVADQETNRRIAAAIEATDDAPIVWLDPTDESTAVSKWTIWATECGQLRIVRVVPSHEAEAASFRVSARKIEKDVPIWTVTEHHHRSLERAFEAAEAILKARRGVRGELDSNRLAILAKAKIDGLDVLPGQKKLYNNIDPNAINEPQNEEKIMHVTEKVAREFFIDCGVKNEIVNEWSTKRLAMKLNDEGLELDEPTGDEFKKLYHDRISWLAKSKEIKLGEAPAAKAAKKAKVETEKPVKSKAAAKPSKNGKPESNGEVDKFGSRVGSMVAAVNKAITEKPRSIADIMERAGITDKGKYKNNHLRQLIEAGHIKKDKDGLYSIK